jgi:hypothetical protein
MQFGKIADMCLKVGKFEAYHNPSYLANTWNMAKLHICFGYVNRETGRSGQPE